MIAKSGPCKPSHATATAPTVLYTSLQPAIPDGVTPGNQLSGRGTPPGRRLSDDDRTDIGVLDPVGPTGALGYASQRQPVPCATPTTRPFIRASSGQSAGSGTGDAGRCPSALHPVILRREAL
jgi:hypothetical protein